MKGSLFSAALLSCAVFSGLTFPLATAGSKVVNIEFQKEPLFSGQLRDVSVPYLGAAALISLGAGAISLSVAGWRSSSQKSSEIAGRLSKLQEELKTKQSQIEDFQLSDSHLTATGLKEFLGASAVQPLPAGIASVSEESSVAASASVLPLYSSPTVVPKTGQFSAQQSAGVVAQPAIAQPVVASSMSAQPVEVVSTMVLVSPAQESSPVSAAIAMMSQFQELQSQLQYMAAQVEKLQTSLEPSERVSALVAQPQVEVLPSSPAYGEIAQVKSAHFKQPQNDQRQIVDPTMIEHLHRRLQQLESDWMRQKVAL
jgi:hypothetical protein